MVELLGPRPFAEKTTYEEFVEGTGMHQQMFGLVYMVVYTRLITRFMLRLLQLHLHSFLLFSQSEENVTGISWNLHLKFELHIDPPYWKNKCIWLFSGSFDEDTDMPKGLESWNRERDQPQPSSAEKSTADKVV